MQPGDIVFFMASNDNVPAGVAHVFIRAAQWLRIRKEGQSPHLPLTGVGIALDQTRVIESAGETLIVTDLSSEQPSRTAVIWSCMDSQLSRSATYIAGQLCRDSFHSYANSAYETLKVGLSVLRPGDHLQMIEARLDESLNVRSDAFCAQVVATAYEVGNLFISANVPVVPAAVFKRRPSEMTTAALATLCDSDDSLFYFAGFWRDGEEVRI